MSEKRKLVIFGVGDFARIAHYYFRHDSTFDVVAHTVTSEFREGDRYLDVPLVDFEDLVKLYPPDDFLLYPAVAYSKVNQNRRKVFTDAKASGYTIATYVCSKATVWPDLQLGEGSFVFENNVIQPYVRIGKDVVLWSGNHIGHDSVIGDHVFIASHVVISGNCRVGDNTFIGVNATVRDGITIGTSCVIGAGTVILSDAADGSVYKGTASEPRGIGSAELRKI